ncbi:MAG: hypothetical protein IJE19_03275 [Clostridia bacterium]|nr:hypothetical protein [Clostridia bacterium]
MTDNEIIKALECCIQVSNFEDCKKCIYYGEIGCERICKENALDLIKRKNTKINELEQKLRDEGEVLLDLNHQLLNVKSETVKEFADKISQLLERYSGVHKHADEARNDTDEYPDGTTSEMTSVWEVQSLTKHGMADYETMSQLQRNIEYIAQDRLLSELEKDFRLLIKEMVDAKNATTSETEHKT